MRKGRAWMVVGERDYTGQNMAYMEKLLFTEMPSLVHVGWDDNLARTIAMCDRGEPPLPFELLAEPNMSHMCDADRRAYLTKRMLELGQHYECEGYTVLFVGFLNNNSKTVWPMLRAASAEAFRWEAYLMDNRKAKKFPEWI